MSRSLHFLSEKRKPNGYKVEMEQITNLTAGFGAERQHGENKDRYPDGLAASHDELIAT